MADDNSGNSNTNLNDLSDQTLGDFRLLRRLGAGGMAEVYLAEQISLHRPVAVKILRHDALKGGDSTLLKRFEQEARAAGGLSDPNIVQVYMIGHEGDLHFIVQEYIQGQNLSQWIKRNGPPEFLTGLKWMRQVASALKAASDAGIVHRDVKPENIMLTRSNDAKVTDFGLAQLNERNEKMNLTQAGTTMGTPWYMSPEQIKGEEMDHRTDQYSFGVSCYHMFSGQPPFPGKNSVSVAVQHLNDTPTPISHYRKDLPEDLCRAIHRMMSKKPADRFSSPEELESTLARLEHAPVNLNFSSTSSLKSWLLASLPTFKQAAVVLLLCTVLGFLISRRLFRPIRLNAESSGAEFQKEDTPQRQFAVAMLQPGISAAWSAVVVHHPESEEALWAYLHLGVCRLEKATPEPVLADEAFCNLLSKTDWNPDQRRQLRFLALLGRAKAAELSGQNDMTARDNIVQTQLIQNYADMFQEEELNAPKVLQKVRNQIVKDFPDLQ